MCEETNKSRGLCSVQLHLTHQEGMGVSEVVRRGGKDKDDEGREKRIP